MQVSLCQPSPLVLACLTRMCEWVNGVAPLPPAKALLEHQLNASSQIKRVIWTVMMAATTDKFDKFIPSASLDQHNFCQCLTHSQTAWSVFILLTPISQILICIHTHSFVCVEGQIRWKSLSSAPAVVSACQPAVSGVCSLRLPCSSSHSWWWCRHCCYVSQWSLFSRVAASCQCPWG